MQHLDGGIVKELRVKEGDKVKAGDVLIVLDDTPGARRIRGACAAVSRACAPPRNGCETELARGTELVMPEDFKARAGDPYLTGHLARARCTSSRAVWPRSTGQRSVIKEKIAQLEHRSSAARRRSRPIARSWNRSSRRSKASRRWSSRA